MRAEGEVVMRPDPLSEGGPVLTFRELTKTFGQTVAVDHVSFDVHSGEIHALVGENGAGKSTLIRMLAGDYSPDLGDILLAGQPVRFADPSEALKHGIGFVHQVPMFVPNLSITENLLLGVPFTRRRAGLIDWQAEHRAARADLAAVGLSLDPRADLETLSAHERQLVAVARALKRGLKVLVLDEVSASLSEPEVRILHSHIRNCAPMASRSSMSATGLRRFSASPIGSRCCGMARRSRRSMSKGSREKNWRGISSATKWAICSNGERPWSNSTRVPRLVVEGLSDERIRNVSFSVSRGEVLGVCGLGGSGRTRLLHMIFGLIPHTSGTIIIDGQRRETS